MCRAGDSLVAELYVRAVNCVTVYLSGDSLVAELYVRAVNCVAVYRAGGGLKGFRLRPGLMLPSDMSYYHYFGSLTTPPCSEVVNWVVMKKPLRVTREQVLVHPAHTVKHRLQAYRPLPLSTLAEGSRLVVDAWSVCAPSLYSGFPNCQRLCTF